MIVNAGSINCDHVYRCAKLPRAGETRPSSAYHRFLGGKGINQSIAAKASGADVTHIGAVNHEDHWIRHEIARFDLDQDAIRGTKEETGHAIIMVDDAAENQILIHGGANQALEVKDISRAIKGHQTPWLMLQNETNIGPEVAELPVRLAYSAAPFDLEETRAFLPHLTLLALNEGEAADLSAGLGADPRNLGLPYLLITRGAKGAELWMGDQKIEVPSFPVAAKDSTGAGDTFLGSFMGRLDQNEEPRAALRYAAAAAAIQVTRRGAAAAIPSKRETLAFLEAQK